MPSTGESSTQTMGIQEQILGMGRRAAASARALAALGAEAKNRILHAMADRIASRRDSILAANGRDLEAGRSSNLTAAFMDRLALDPERIEAMAGGVRDVARLPDLIGEEITATRRPNGLLIRKVRVPLGVVAMIYESRPNVTADAAALCFKAGNAVILRGGSEAAKSNAAILEAMLEGGASAGLPEDAIQLVATTDRRAVDTLLRMDQYVDLVIPRGGESLIRAVAERSTVPVLKHYKGVCHVYVDRAADPEMALEIAVNSKCQRPGCATRWRPSSFTQGSPARSCRGQGRLSPPAAWSSVAAPRRAASSEAPPPPAKPTGRRSTSISFSPSAWSRT